mgnify:CR=1 FL=1
MRWSVVGLVNKPNTLYRFENILKYRCGILKNWNNEISEFRYQLQYRLKWYYWPEDYVILMIFS